MKKATALAEVLTTALGFATFNAHANLLSGSTLGIGLGSFFDHEDRQYLRGFLF